MRAGWLAALGMVGVLPQLSCKDFKLSCVMFIDEFTQPVRTSRRDLVWEQLGSMKCYYGWLVTAMRRPWFLGNRLVPATSHPPRTEEMMENKY